MKNPIASHYRVLFPCLFSWLPWMNWLWALGAATAIMGISIYFIWNNPLGFLLGGVILGVAAFMSLAGLPSQMLSIGSSKQIGILPGIREASLRTFVFISLCASLAIGGMLCIVEHRLMLGTFAALWILVSVVLIAAVFMGQRYAGSQTLILLCCSFLKPLYKSLMNVHWVLLLIACIILWVAFSRHWLRWRPGKFQPNIFGMSHDQLLAFSKQRSAQSRTIIEWRDRFLGGKAETLVGSLLLGRSDGGRSKLVSAASTLFILLFIVGVFIALSGTEKFKIYYEIGGQINICIIYICAGYGLSLSFFRNFHKAWMYFDGCRESYFTFIEKMFFGRLWMAIVPVFIIHIAINYFILDWQLYIELLFMTIVYALIVIATAFYTLLFIYHKTKGNLNWSMWVNNLLLLAAAVPLIACNLLWVDHKFQVMKWVMYFIIASVVALIIFRRCVKQKWMSVDLVRVKS
jgi:hypothetical protein